MTDDTAKLRSQLRDAETKARVAETALKDVKARSLKYSVWAATAGFLLFAVGGHWIPGYQLDRTAEATSNELAVSAVSDVMAQLCAERFMRTSGLESRLAALDEASGDWSKASYIRDGTWAAKPDGERADHATADKCRSLIAERVSGESRKAS